MSGERSRRDPRRSLAIGVALAVCVLGLLAAIVLFGIYYTFSARQDRSGLAPTVDSRFGLCPVAALDCGHV